MTPELDYLRRLIEAAEPCPWKAYSYPDEGAVVKDTRGEMLIGKHPDGRPDLENARLIATLRNIAPAVLELLEALASHATDGDSQKCLVCEEDWRLLYSAIREQMPQPPYPQFCHYPDKCAQAHRCLRDPVCND